MGTRVVLTYRATASARTSLHVFDARGHAVGIAFTHCDRVGVNRVVFHGRVHRHGKVVALRRGRYRLRGTARDDGGRSRPVSVAFTVTDT